MSAPVAQSAGAIFPGWHVVTSLKWHLAPAPKVSAETFLRAYRSTVLRMYAIVGWEPGNGWHLSISHPSRYPTWDEIKAARYDLLPDACTMGMLLPPQDEYVNVHPNCFHLHEVTP